MVINALADIEVLEELLGHIDGVLMPNEDSVDIHVDDTQAVSFILKEHNIEFELVEV